MVVAVAKALEDGASAIICASTGNTSASAAAYGAGAGLEVVVVLPRGQIAAGKLLQAIVAGARVVAVDGNFDAALRVVRALAEQDDHPVTLVNSVNPYRLEGQKTAAFEVCDDLGRAPDVLAIPVGNAGNISAYWAGFRDYAAGRDRRDAAADARLPGGRRRAARAGPADRRSRRRSRPRSGSATRRRGQRPIAARDESGGAIEAVTDDEILAAYRVAGRGRGHLLRAVVGGELAGVAAAGGSRATSARDALVVCVLTGSGLKDPDDGRSGRGGHAVIEAEPTVGAVTVALGW